MKNIFYTLILLASMLSFGACNSDNEGSGATDTDIPKEEQTQTRSTKRGVGHNFQLPEEDTKLMGDYISWAYNWDNTASDILSTQFKKYEIDFCPMAWNANSTIIPKIRTYVTAHPECKYLLAYNEPNLTDQARMTPAQAAAEWPALRALAKELNLKIISPAMNYGTLANYSDPTKWLDEFFTLVPISDIDGISIHCYMESASALKSYIEKFKKYDKPIWLTEFCPWPSNQKSTASDQMNYISEAINYLEANPDVCRYAWFIPRGNGPKDPATGYNSNNLLAYNANKLTEVGKVYFNMSTLDKDLYYIKGQEIPAEHYNGINVEKDLKSNCIRLRPTTDTSGILEVYDFKEGQWLEYQLAVAKTGTYKLELRYSSYRENQAEITIDGGSKQTINFPNVDKKWTTVTANIQLKAGKQTLRINVTTGNIYLNWLRFSN